MQLQGANGLKLDSDTGRSDVQWLSGDSGRKFKVGRKQTLVRTPHRDVLSTPRVTHCSALAPWQPSNRVSWRTETCSGKGRDYPIR